MKRILVPCDFTTTALNAFRFACEMASQTKSEIFVLYVVELPHIYSPLPVPVHAYESAFLGTIKEKVNKQFEKMKKSAGKKLKIHFNVESGSVLSATTRFASKKRIDLIVMGTHGSSGIREYMIGSNAEKIVRTSAVPVIAVKKMMKPSGIKDILFPTDLGPVQKDFLIKLKSLQERLKATIHILYVNTPANFSADLATGENLTAFVKENNLRNYTINIFNDLSEARGITHFASIFKNKMIAMATHGRTPLGHLLMGSIAENIVNHIDCPIWTYTQRKK
ncbi:universal stress protein UspA [Cytophagales bacterium WSM2-2]|nr:universal stress protein UspA [Cytophagales bacterium WSM2-2]